jgi:hypothetical protein
MLCHVAILRTDISEERSASIIRVTRIGHLGTLAVISNWRKLWINKCIDIYVVFLCGMRQLLVTANGPSSPVLVSLMMKVPFSSETSVPMRAIRLNVPAEGILQNTVLIINKVLQNLRWLSCFSHCILICNEALIWSHLTSIMSPTGSVNNCLWRAEIAQLFSY